MSQPTSLLKLGLWTGGLVASLLAVSCNPPTQQPVSPPTPPHPEVGRYQIVVSNEGERGSVLFLLDTKEGATWIYRPPQGPVFNGFWSDIPRVTNPQETWQQAFQQLMTPRPGGTNAPATPTR
jgi:hypothetical protein